MNFEKIRFTLRLNNITYSFIAEEAQKKGLTKNALICEILWSYFEGRSKNDI